MGACTGGPCERRITCQTRTGLIAVKPQMMQEALPTLQAMGAGKLCFCRLRQGSLLELTKTFWAQIPHFAGNAKYTCRNWSGDYSIDWKCRIDKDHIDLAHALLSAIGELLIWTAKVKWMRSLVCRGLDQLMCFI